MGGRVAQAAATGYRGGGAAMAGEVDQCAWRELGARVLQEPAAWRAAPPCTTLSAIETAVAAATRRIPAQ